MTTTEGKCWVWHRGWSVGLVLVRPCAQRCEGRERAGICWERAQAAEGCVSDWGIARRPV